MSVAPVIALTRYTQIVSDIEDLIGNAEARLNTATHECNESQIAQWQGYLEIAALALLTTQNTQPWARIETLAHLIHRQEAILTETQAKVWSHLMERQGKRNACRALWRLLQA